MKMKITVKHAAPVNSALVQANRSLRVGLLGALAAFICIAVFTSAQTPGTRGVKDFAPASVQALPGLKCNLHNIGDTVSVPLDTDDDGYARFYAVRANTDSDVREMALDCEDSSGAEHSYPVDLTSEDTFVSRPLNLANERGTARPALIGDPMSYSQSELIEAGYGLRPDPSDAEGYSHWLAAATVSGRQLASKPDLRRSSRHTVTKTTAAPWSGSVMTGKPKYVAISGTFTVPKAIPGGDGTKGTEIALWNGLGGFGTGSGLIQSGVGIATSTTAATYYTWREYCCGDGDSNGYSGTFTPSPGDLVYAENWYCDAKGNLNLNGGYGCSFVEDETTGAIFNCTVANAKPCWSVKALPQCSVKAVKNCMTLGLAAEFVIENQTPQCCKGQTAFTDFSPKVTMAGSAYSNATKKFSQETGNDPTVFLLEDFTTAVTKMNVSLVSPDETIFSITKRK